MRKLKRQPTPVVDFPHDKNLQELHDIREEIQRELQGLTPQEVVDHINELGRQAAEARGYRYVPTGRGTYRLEPIKKKKRA